MKINKYIFAAVSVMVPLLWSCTDEEYKLYDTTQKDSVFFDYRNSRNETDSVTSYNFGYDIADSHTIELPVVLMGMPKDHARVINIIAVADSSTMIEGTHYTITDNVIPANEVAGTVKINLLRGKDPQLLEKSFKLRLTVGENDDLKSVGNNSFTIIYSDIRPDSRPSWWTTYSTLPVYSFENAQLFFDYFYRLAPLGNIDIYTEMISRYGDYFVKASSMQGPLAMYDSFLRQYVLIPMAKENPELEWQERPEW